MSSIEISEPAPPLPLLSDSNRFFWTSGAEGVLRMLRCSQCEYFVHPPRPLCPMCSCSDLLPAKVSGLATIQAFTLNYQAWMPGLKVPYVVATVELDEQPGLRLTTNIVDTPPESVRIGHKVKVTFRHVEDVWLPLFAPLSASIP